MNLFLAQEPGRYLWHGPPDINPEKNNSIWLSLPNWMQGPDCLILVISGLLQECLNGQGKVLYPDIKENVYEFMINGASSVPPGSNGVKIIPKFYEELKGEPGGKILGLTMDSTRDEIYRAMLEALSQRLKEGKDALEKAGGFKTDSILCVGGGSKNRLWNQLRADYSAAYR